MRKLKLFFAVVFILSFSAASYAFAPSVGFLKHNKPFKTGYLKVSDIHEIYYEQSGNPKGKPVFFLHGGPGVGFTANSRQAFDPKKFMVVLYDQRGCARSKPLYETRENTT